MPDELARVDGVQLLLDLEKAGAVTSTALILTDPELPFEKYEALGVFLVSIERRTNWYMGDWFNFGQMVYGDVVWQAVFAAGLSREKIEGYQEVCKAIPRSRRRASLSFGCHKAVKDLPVDEQEEWLKRAVQERWSSTEMRAAMRPPMLQDPLPLEPEPEVVDPVEPQPPDVETPAPFTPRLAEAAWDLLDDAKPTEDGQAFVVPRNRIEDLRVALGREF